MRVDMLPSPTTRALWRECGEEQRGEREVPERVAADDELEAVGGDLAPTRRDHQSGVVDEGVDRAELGETGGGTRGSSRAR